MSLDEFRQRMDSYLKAVDKEAHDAKISSLSTFRLHNFYESLDSEERKLADQVLAEWVLSEDDGVRFEALALIEDFKLIGARPALQKLKSRLKSSRTPGAPFEIEKIDRILRILSFR